MLAGLRWADGVAGLLVTGFICHVGWEVTTDVVHRLMDGTDPAILRHAEAVAAEVPGVQHVHVRARTTGRALRLDVEGWVDATTTVQEADRVGQLVAERLASEIPEMRAFTWAARGV